MPENSRAYKFPHRTHNVCSCVNIAQRASHGLLDLNKPTAPGPAARASTNESSHLECTMPLRFWKLGSPSLAAAGDRRRRLWPAGAAAAVAARTWP